MSTLHLQSIAQAFAPTRLLKSSPAPLPTGNLGSGSAAPSLFAENGVIWGADSNNNMYLAGFTSIFTFEAWAANISAGWPSHFTPMDNAQYGSMPFGYQDSPTLRCAAGVLAARTGVYACKPALAPMCRMALTALAAQPGANAGCAMKSLGSTCTALTANGSETMAVAYLMLVPDTTKPYLSIWNQGYSF